MGCSAISQLYSILRFGEFRVTADTWHNILIPPSPPLFFYSGDLAGSVWSSAGAPGQEQSCAARTGVSDCDTFVRSNGASFQEACMSLFRFFLCFSKV